MLVFIAVQKYKTARMLNDNFLSLAQYSFGEYKNLAKLRKLHALIQVNERTHAGACVGSGTGYMVQLVYTVIQWLLICWYNV